MTFCRKCGQPLDERLVAGGFDPSTGEQLFRLRRRCPSRRWMHDSRETPAHPRDWFGPDRSLDWKPRA